MLFTGPGPKEAFDKAGAILSLGLSLSLWSRSVVSDSLRPHVLEPPRLLGPWDSPGKNNGVGYHPLRDQETEVSEAKGII